MISIIVPVYNAEKYIRTCIESILRQSYEDLDIILVNDHSSDNSLLICQEYAQKDTRIQVIDCKENAGPGKAREIGYKKAKGEWICYADSDDYLEPDMFEKLRAYLKTDADLYVFGLIMSYEDRKGRIISQEAIIPRRQCVTHPSQMGKLVMDLDAQRVLPYMCSKVYKAAFLRRNPPKFIKTDLMEDFFYNMQVFSAAEHVEVCDHAFYHYRRPYKTATLATVYRSDFFALSKQRYKACETFLLEKGETDPACWQIAYSSYLKHLLSCLSRDASEGLSLKLRREYAKQYLEDALTADILGKYQADSGKLKIILHILKRKHITEALILGKAIDIFQNRFKNLYHKIKPI